MSDPLELQRVMARRLYTSADDAAVDTLNKIDESHYEQGGVIFKHGGIYSTSEPAGDKRTGQFTVNVKVPKGETPVGIYHTHPGEARMSEKFSPEDVKAATQLKMMSYIRALESGQVRKFEPGVSGTQSVGTGLGRGSISPGQVIFAKQQQND